MSSVGLQVFAAVAAVLLLALAASAVGQALAWSSRVGLDFGTEMLAGLGFLGVALFLVGMIAWGRAVVDALLLPLSCVGAWQTLRRPPRWRLPSGWGWLAIITPLLIWLSLDGLVLPMGNFGSDPVAYHLSGPALWLRWHHIAPVPDVFGSTYPQLIETLFGAVMAVANVRAVGVLAIGLALLLLNQLWRLTLDLGGDSWSAALAVALFAAMPAVMNIAPQAYVDIAYAAFALAGARVAWRAETSRAWVLAGAFFGFALGSRYLGLALLAATGLALLPRYGQRRVPRRDLAFCLGVAVVVGGAWYLRNWLVFGTPIYPSPLALRVWFPSPGFSPFQTRSFEQYLQTRARGFGASPLALLLLPFHLTFATAVFQGGGGIGIAPLALAPLALPRFWRDPRWRFWLVWALLLTLAWFYSHQEIRFLIPPLAVVTALAALAAAPLLRRSAWPLRTAAAAAVALSLLYGMGGLASDQGQRPARIATLFSRTAANTVWHREVPYADAFAFLNADPSVQSVLIVDPFVVTYYLHRPYLHVGLSDALSPLGVSPRPDALRHLDQLGVSHVLDVESEISGFQVRPSPDLHLVFSSPHARVYRVVAGASPVL